VPATRIEIRASSSPRIDTSRSASPAALGAARLSSTSMLYGRWGRNARQSFAERKLRGCDYGLVVVGGVTVGGEPLVCHVIP
jgi:hypothetical protein